MKCSKCEKDIPNESGFCPYCGGKIPVIDRIIDGMILTRITEGQMYLAVGIITLLLCGLMFVVGTQLSGEIKWF